MTSVADLPKATDRTGADVLARSSQAAESSIQRFVRYLADVTAAPHGKGVIERVRWRLDDRSGHLGVIWNGTPRQQPPPNHVSAAEMIAVIRRQTDCSYDQIARMLGVSRQTLHLWQHGQAVSDPHLRRLLALRDVLSRAARRYTTPEAMRVWLNTPRGSGGRTPTDLLAAGEFDRARLLAMAPINPAVTPPMRLNRGQASSMRAGRESRIEAYPPESSTSDTEPDVVDDDEPADDGWVE